MKHTLLILFSSLTLSASAQSTKVQELPITRKDLIKHFSLKAFKWEHRFDKDFDSVIIKIIYHKPIKDGKYRENLLGNVRFSADNFPTKTGNHGEAGTYPITFMIDKDRCSYSVLGQTVSNLHSWAEFETHHVYKPKYTDSNYIFNIHTNEVFPSKDKPYISMSITTEQIN